MDYNSLTLQIQQYAKRTDQFFLDQIPNFIDQAINRIYLEAKNIGFEIVIQGNLTINDPLLNKPANWKETVSFALIDDRNGTVSTTFLFLRVKEFCKSYWPNPTITSMPEFYADNGYSQFYIAATPDYAYPIEIIYLGLPLFNVQNPVNFLTARYPNLLLYASMLEATPFLKDDERVPVFESFYNRALQNINLDAKKLYNDRVSKRDVT